MPEWVCVAAGAKLADGEMIPISVPGKHLILYRVADEYFATDRRCTHQGADLNRGYFDQEVIECPVHQGRFSVRTGAALSAPACDPLKTYPVRLLNGEVYVQVA